MQTFNEKIRNYLGNSDVDNYVSNFGSDAISTFLTEGVAMIINMMPKDMLWQLSVKENFTNTVIVPTNKIISVRRTTDNNYYDSTGGDTPDSKYVLDCREVHSKLKGRAVQYGGFMEEASDLDPLYYKENGVVSILPIGSGEIEYVEYPNVIDVQYDIPGFPHEGLQCIVIYATIQILSAMIKESSELGSSNIGSVSELTISANVPSLSSTISDPQDFGETIGVIPEAPQFNPPVSNPNFSRIDDYLDEEDIDLVGAAVGGIQAEIQKYQLDIQNESAQYQDAVLKYNADVNKIMKQAEMNIGTSTAEYTAKVQKYSAEVQKYTGDIQSYATEVQKEVSEHTAEISKLQIEIGEYSAILQAKQLEVQTFMGVLKDLRGEYSQCVQSFLGFINKESLEPQKQNNQGGQG